VPKARAASRHAVITWLFLAVEFACIAIQIIYGALFTQSVVNVAYFTVFPGLTSSR
jgi:hypothetical protein